MDTWIGNTQLIHLKNGLTCYIGRTAQKNHIMSLCLTVKAGSFYERKGEFGWSHFLEHLLISPFLHTNNAKSENEGQFLAFDYAYTSFAETSYLFRGVDETGELLVDSIMTSKGILEGRYLNHDSFQCTKEDVLKEHMDMTSQTWFLHCATQLKEKGITMPVGEWEDIFKADYKELCSKHHDLYDLKNASLIILTSHEINKIVSILNYVFSETNSMYKPSNRHCFRSYVPNMVSQNMLQSDIYLAWISRKKMGVPEILEKYMEIAVLSRTVELAALRVHGINIAECEIEIFSEETYLVKLMIGEELPVSLFPQKLFLSEEIFKQARGEIKRQLLLRYEGNSNGYSTREFFDLCKENFLYEEPMIKLHNELEYCRFYVEQLQYETMKEKFHNVIKQFCRR